jgi:hypothetical protein
MRVIIIAVANIVEIDGEPQIVDCSALVAEGVHAVQWYDTRGEIEYINPPGQAFRLNEAIDDFTSYQSYLDAWQVAHDNPPPGPPRPETPQAHVSVETAKANSIRSDYEREEFVAMIRDNGPDGIRAHVYQNVTDLDQAKEYLIKLTLLVAADIRK